jgi:membrane protein
MLAFAVLVVLGPLIWRGLVYWLPGLDPFGWIIAFLRLVAATILIVSALIVSHKFVPAGRRGWRIILPGIAITLVLWIVGGLVFGWYLESFPSSYASMYGGLTTAMVALVFLYWLAAMFLFGGEINGTVIAAKRRRIAEATRARFNDVVKTP